jgi:hypothetical protein
MWTVFTMFMGAFLGYFFGLLNEARLQRQATYDEVMKYLSEYRMYVSERQRPDAKFIASAFWVNRQVHDRFSESTYCVWRAVERLITADATLPPEAFQTDYDTMRDNALAAMHEEVRSWRWLIGFIHRAD